MPNPLIGITLGVDGAEASASAIEGVGKRGATAMERLRGSFTQLGERADYFEGRTKKVVRGVNDATGAIELASRAIPGLSGSFGALAGTLGNVADVFGTLSNILLRNPIGLAAIAATGAFVAYKAYTGAAEDSAESTKRFTDAITAAEQAITKLRESSDPNVATLQRLKTELEEQQQKIAPLAAQWKLYGEVQAEVRGKIQLTAEQQAKVDEAGQRSTRAAQSLQAQFENLNRSKLDVKLREIAGEIIRMGGSMEKAAAEIARGENAMRQLQAQIDRTNFGKVRDQLEEFALGDKGRIERDFRQRQEQLDKLFDENNPGEYSRLSRLNREKMAKDLQALEPKATGGGKKAEVDTLPDQYARLAASLDPVIARERELVNTNLVLDEAQKSLGISTEEITRLKGLAAQKAYEASEAGKADAAAVQEATRLVEAARTPMEDYERQLQAIARALELNAINEEQAKKAREQAKTQLEQATEESKGAKRTARELGLAFSSAFEDAVVGGKKLRDVITGLGQDLLRVFIRRQLTEPLLELANTVFKNSGLSGLFGGIGKGLGDLIGGMFGGGSSNAGQIVYDGPVGPFPFARGGVFAGGAEVIPFARGGAIVNRPTLFPMRGGKMGLMGEQRPEAIMPLDRDSQGVLGVRMRGAGGGAVFQITNSIDARGADKSLRDALPAMLRQNAEQTIAQIERLSDRGGSFSRKLGRRTTG